MKKMLKRALALVLCLCLLCGLVPTAQAAELAITTQPKSVTVKEGATAKVTIAATGDGLSYTWYFKNASATMFSKTTSFTGTSYSVSMDASRDGRQVYCVVTDKYGNSVQTKTATLSMGNTATITQQPKSVTVKEGATAKVTIAATGDGLTYTWYYKDAGASKFSKTTSFTGTTYSVAMTNARNGRQVYCVVKDKYGNSVQTATATLNMGNTATITTQPKSVTVMQGTTAKVTFAATGDGLTYTWYFKNPGATKFSKTTSFTGNTYSVSMDASRSGRQVYCIVKDKYGNSVQTNTVTLSMATPVAITAQPTNVWVNEGETARVTFTATGDGLTYAWYIAKAGSTSFSKSSITAASYGVKMSATANGRQVYCVITDKYGNSVQTNTVTVNMKTPLAITTQPQSVTVKEGATAKVTFAATGDGLTYTWYFKNPTATKFSKTTSFTGNTYSVKMDASRDGRQVYCIIKDQHGNSVQTNTVTLSMQHPVKLVSQPQEAWAYEGETAKVTVEATGDGLTYTWYIAAKGSTKFSKSSITSNAYGVKMSATNNGRQVYCVISDAYGNTVTTDIVTLTMVEPLEITKQPESIWVDNGEKATVTVEATGEGLTYEWYYKNAGASKFTKTTSFKSNSYSLTMDASRDGRQVYCVITDVTGNSLKTDVAMLCLMPEGLEYYLDSYNRCVCIQGYSGSNSVLHIPSEIEGYPVTRIESWAFQDCDYLTSITIPYGVTSMGDYGTFYGCDLLTSITIPNTVTNIGASAFYNCISLKSITLPNGVTSIGSSAFNGCSSLTSITIPNSVTSIGEFAFYYCSSLTSITIPDSVTSIEKCTFEGCSSLINITIPSGVTNIGDYAFDSCSSLTSITIPNSVTSIGEFAFRYCSSLTSITIPDSVTSIGDGTFACCTSLTSITIPSGVTSIGDQTFSSCTSLTSISIPSSVTSIGEYAFYSCDSLTSITIPNGVTSIDYKAISYCDSLTSITIPNSVTSIDYYAFYPCDSLTSIYVHGDSAAYKFCKDNGYSSKIKLMITITQQPENAYVFDGETATVSVTATGEKLKYQWYYADPGATEVTKSSITTSVYSTTMSAAKSGRLVYCVITDANGCCEVVTEEVTLNVVSRTVNILEQPQNARADEGETATVTVKATGEGLTYTWYYKDVGASKFSKTTSFTGTTYSVSMNDDRDGRQVYCVVMDKAGNKAQTDTVTLALVPDELYYSVYNDAVTITGCDRNATKLTIPSQIGGLPVKEIGAWAFFNRDSLTSITIPNSVTSIGSHAFDDCDSLTSITIPNSVTSIGSDAFYSCSSLTSIVIPASVTSIGGGMLAYCPNVTVKCTVGSAAHTYCKENGIAYRLQ